MSRGGASAWQELKSPVADVEIIPCAKHHGTQAQDLHSMVQRALRDLRLREPHQYVVFQIGGEDALRRACMLIFCAYQRDNFK